MFRVITAAPRANQTGYFRSYRPAALSALLALAGLFGCNDKPAATAPPPADVSVSHPVQKEVVEWDTYTGYIEAPQTVNVAARVSGLIVDMPFVEGSLVKRGDVLANIDERPFKADLDSKKANTAKSDASLAIANLTYNRLLGLQNSSAVSQQDIDNAKAAVDQAKAVLTSSRADEETSRLNLEWCKVLSPVDGRASYKWVTAGNLVTGGTGQVTYLTSVQSIDPVYCYFDVDENSVLKYQKLAEERKLTSARDGKVPCYVQLGNETDFSHEGYVDFVDNRVDPTTGTHRVRGVLKNQSGLLTPGFFARLCVPGSGRYTALLIPDTAIGNDQNQRTVLIVDKDNKVSARPVQLGALFGAMRSIVSGLNADEWVVVNGQMHARPGSVVKPAEVAVKLDDRAFSDPGLSIARTIPTTQASHGATAMNLLPTAATQPSIGMQQ